MPSWGPDGIACRQHVFKVLQLKLSCESKRCLHSREGVVEPWPTVSTWGSSTNSTNFWVFSKDQCRSTRKPLSTKTPPPGHSAKKSLCPGKAGRSDTWTTGLARQKLWWMVSGRPSAPRGKVGRPTTFRRGAKLVRLGTAWPPWASARRNTIQMSLVSTARQQEYSAMFGEQLIQGIAS